MLTSGKRSGRDGLIMVISWPHWHCSISLRQFNERCYVRKTSYKSIVIGPGRFVKSDRPSFQHVSAFLCHRLLMPAAFAGGMGRSETGAKHPFHSSPSRSCAVALRERLARGENTVDQLYSQP